ncbi:MAG: 16S rRNA (cytosine(1402)-N(4))-methyltransferase RsmH, partial [Pseudomonadota bacterium]
MSAAAAIETPHVPVLLDAILTAVAPVEGVWVDGTLGAGGYTRGFLQAGAKQVVGIDRDPLAIQMASEWGADCGDRLRVVQARFSEMDEHVDGADGVVLDLGVSSMQLDRAERGFSFQKDGPLDMRMGQAGRSAADIVNEASEDVLADILYLFGEERASRRIARAIVRARPLETTLELADVVSGCLPRAKPGQAHPATRSFQALRIAVNEEYVELVDGLEAAERALRPGGQLAVVTFHSVEDRIVKRFLQAKADAGGGGSRHGPQEAAREPQFELKSRKAVQPSDAEVASNPRARSAKLRLAVRTDAAHEPTDRRALGTPELKRS